MTDIIKYCDVNNCEECPRYGDDCDGDKRVEHTDYISRADAIDALSRSSVYAWSTEQDQTAHYWALNIINALPSAEAEWIPCSERLPSEERYYLCCNKGYLPFIAHYYGGQWHDFYGIISHVDAWQPLPKPYREDGEE